MMNAKDILTNGHVAQAVLPVGMAKVIVTLIAIVKDLLFVMTMPKIV